jgi:hypothetical protein
MWLRRRKILVFVAARRECEAAARALDFYNILKQNTNYLFPSRDV